MVSHPPQTEKTRQIELDFLRGLAILAVLDYHDSYEIFNYPLRLLGFPSIGWIGVDIFFVLSGFLVGGLLIREWTSTGGLNARRFLIRRIFKIWPQYYFFLSAVILTGHQSLRAMWPAFFNIQNYIITIPHLWTLAVEEHAYILLVLLVILAARLRVTTRTAFLVIAGLCAAVVTLRLFLAVHNYPFMMGTHTRVEGILYGVLLALLFHRAPALFSRLQELRWLWISTLLLALAGLRPTPSKPWALSLTFDLANLVGISLLMLLSRHRPGHSRPWIYRAIAWIGLYSYGIYLWHVSVYAPVASLALRIPPDLRPAFTAVGQPFFGIAFGVLLTRFVEFPMLRLRERFFPRIPRYPYTGPQATTRKEPELLVQIEPIL
jgi:peptidoglycan/LPS O-acetylase OafA/YrhL